MDTEFSCIICVADMNITNILDQCLSELALPEIFVQRAKQISLVDRHGFFGLRPDTSVSESRALIYRVIVPEPYADGIMRRIADVTDLRMGGRGSIFAQHIGMLRGTPLVFDTETIERLCGGPKKIPRAAQALITCIVPRGTGDALALAALELGLCVPVISFGTGMGLRDKLGLLRITIPVEKEIIWFLVSRSDAELVEKNLIRRARLDVPGQGFLYKFFVHAPVVNLRLRQGKRVHAATMEQIIAALDEVHGSSEWRRQGSSGRYRAGSGEHEDINAKGLFFIGEDDEVEIYRRTAMENGAHGATLNPVEMYSFSALREHAPREQAKESRSRKLCDIIVSPAAEEKLEAAIRETGLLDSGKSCTLKNFDVEMPSLSRK